MTEPRAYTKEEVRKNFLLCVLSLADYWATVEERDVREKLHGLVFSLMTIFDGGAMEFPALNIVLDPHPEDKDFCIEEGENWCEPGMIINDDVQLHELLCQEEKSREG